MIWWSWIRIGHRQRSSCTPRWYWPMDSLSMGVLACRVFPRSRKGQGTHPTLDMLRTLVLTLCRRWKLRNIWIRSTKKYAKIARWFDSERPPLHGFFSHRCERAHQLARALGTADVVPNKIIPLWQWWGDVEEQSFCLRLFTSCSHHWGDDLVWDYICSCCADADRCSKGVTC